MKVLVKQLGFGILLGAFAATAELQNVQVGGSVDIRNRMRMPATIDGVSTQRDRTDISVTVYNNDLALVRDSRRVRVDAGEHTVRFSDVAAQIKPQTVKFSANHLAVRVLEQNYEYDLITPSKLMEKYVGRMVKIQDFNSHSSAGTVEAELLSVNEGSVYKVGNEIFIGRPGHVALPELPQELAARPTLQWLLESSQSLEADFEVSYLTGGISWNADYVVTIAKDEKSLDVEGWVTLANHCGATFENAQLKLVAGEVNRVREELPRRMERGISPNGAMYLDFAREETFGEYHLYALPRRTTIKQNQSKQVSLLSAADAGVTKHYEYRGNSYFYSQQIAPMVDQKIGVFLVFVNKKENKLGMPLPAGVMRVYQEDQTGALQFAGEDRIKHTPKDEEVKLRLGNAFDVVAERTQTDFRIVADQVFESAYEIKIRNHKESDVVVEVAEELDNDWTILTKSHEFVKKDARTAVFSLPVPKDGETVLTYSVRLSHGVPRPLPLAAPTAAPRPRAIKAVPPRAVSVPAIAPDAR